MSTAFMLDNAHECPYVEFIHSNQEPGAVLLFPPERVAPEENEMIKIDKGIEIPRIEQRPSKYPWDGMMIGDSFFWAGKSAPSLHSVGVGWAQRKGKKWKFKSRTIVEPDPITKKPVKGVRIWRVK